MPVGVEALAVARSQRWSHPWLEDAAMKRWSCLFLLLVVPCLLMAESETTPTQPAASDRLFFPRDAIWGYGQFDIAPPHNEVDPNLCRADSGQYGGVNAPCNAFARYVISGKVELRPFGRTALRRFMLFVDPTFLFGKNVPQTLYTWSMKPIGVDRTWGLGIDMPRRFELRVTQHFLFQRLGSTDQYLGAADLGPNGPWGRYTTLGVRKYFGRQREGVQ
jgi:hypothetical protein